MLLVSILVPAAIKCAFTIIVGAAAYVYVPEWLSTRQRFAYTK
tara:strand:+ start:86 stop:214 length:129 start_codon:yes stop_codon:yes gene_type:complete